MGHPAVPSVATTPDFAAILAHLQNHTRATLAGPGMNAESVLTLDAAGAVTLDRHLHRIDTYLASGTDDLDNVDGSALEDGGIFCLSLENVAHVPRLRHMQGGAGQLDLKYGEHVELTTLEQRIWFEVDRSGTEIHRELWREGFPDTVIAKTANHNVLDTEHGVTFTNAGAGGAVAFNLPAARAGLRYRFVCAAAQNVQVVPAAGDEVMFEGTAAADGYEETGVGSYLEVLAIDATTWLAIASHGTWTGIP